MKLSISLSLERGPNGRRTHPPEPGWIPGIEPRCCSWLCSCSGQSPCRTQESPTTHTNKRLVVKKVKRLVRNKLLVSILAADPPLAPTCPRRCVPACWRFPPRRWWSVLASTAWWQAGWTSHRSLCSLGSPPMSNRWCGWSGTLVYLHSTRKRYRSHSFKTANQPWTNITEQPACLEFVVANYTPQSKVKLSWRIKDIKMTCWVLTHKEKPFHQHFQNCLGDVEKENLIKATQPLPLSPRE